METRRDPVLRQATRRFVPLLSLSAVLLSAWLLTAVQAHAGAVKIMSFNITTVHSYIGNPAIRILQGLKPDIALLQEFKDRNSDYRGFVDEAFGTDFVYYRGPGIGGAFNQSNGIVSRWPFKDSGSWDDVVVQNRYFDWAVIDLPGNAPDIQVVSIHLKAGTTPEDKDTRVTEATNLKALIEANFAADQYIMIAGDMNTVSRDSEPALIAVFDSYLTTSDGTPADRNGNNNTNVNRVSAFDWLIPNQLLGDVITTLTVGSSGYLGGIVFDSRVFTPLSELPPILETDTASGDMDHCPIMKSYDLPIPISTPTPVPTPVPGKYNWPLYLQVNKKTFSQSDHIRVTVTFRTCRTPSTPSIWLTRPDGSKIYLRRIPAEERSRLLPSNSSQQFIEGGPWVLDFDLAYYPVLNTDFNTGQTGTWTLEAAYLDLYGNFVGGVSRMKLTVE